MSKHRVATYAITLFALTTLTACKTDLGLEGCDNDNQCDAGFICNSASRTCRCTTDDACGANKFCTTQGFCQDRPPCISNVDCPAQTICNIADASGGSCIPNTDCGANTHCPFNQICDPASRHCITGCKSTDDCQLGYVCDAGQCTAGDCTECPASPDVDPSFCKYGDTCNSDGRCSPHATKSALCHVCDQNTPCPDGLICLIDNDGTNYCAPVCQNDAECPNGYTSAGCGGLTVVWEECTGGQTCTNGGRCAPQPEGRSFCECTSQADCGYPTGLCMLNLCLTAQCSSDRDCSAYGVRCNSLFGVCDLHCGSDADCLCQGGKCLGGGFACNSAADCELSCVQRPASDGNNYGVCETKQKACGKENGVTCSQLTSGQAACQGL